MGDDNEPLLNGIAYTCAAAAAVHGAVAVCGAVHAHRTRTHARTHAATWLYVSVYLQRDVRTCTNCMAHVGRIRPCVWPFLPGGARRANVSMCCVSHSHATTAQPSPSLDAHGNVPDAGGTPAQTSPDMVLKRRKRSKKKPMALTDKQIELLSAESDKRKSAMATGSCVCGVRGLRMYWCVSVHVVARARARVCVCVLKPASVARLTSCGAVELCQCAVVPLCVCTCLETDYVTLQYACACACACAPEIPVARVCARVT